MGFIFANAHDLFDWSLTTAVMNEFAFGTRNSLLLEYLEAVYSKLVLT